MEQNNPINFNNPKKNNSKWVVGIFVALLAALLLSSMAGETIKSLFNSLLSGITPVLIAAVISFLFLKPMKFLEDKMMKNLFVGNTKANKYKRAISLAILYTVTIGVIVLLIALAIPSIIGLVQQFADQTQLAALMENLKEVIITVLQFFGMPLDDAVNNATALIATLTEYIDTIINSITLEGIFGLVSPIFSIFMGVLISFLLLKDKELIAKTARRYTYAYYPRKNAEEMITVTRRTNDMLNQYVISTLTICAVIFIITWIGFWIMGVPYAFAMSLLFGILSIVPYIGGFIALVPLLMVTLMAGDINLFMMSAIYGIAVWALVTTFLPPLVMSKRMNTRALIIILALVIGGALFGVVGMILSGPVASVITVIMNERLQVREARREHEEMVEAGIIDKDFYNVGDMLDLTQDTVGLDITIEKEEDDFKKLQAIKHKDNDSQIIDEEQEDLDIELKSKSSKKEKINKKKLSSKTDKVDKEITEE